MAGLPKNSTHALQDDDQLSIRGVIKTLRIDAIAKYMEFAHTFRVYGFSKCRKSLNLSCTEQMRGYIQRFSPLSVALVSQCSSFF